MTDDIVERVDPPPTPEPNHPPSIVETSVEPTNWDCKVFKDVSCNTPMVFKVKTIVDIGTDGDNHRLFARWFLDYNPDPLKEKLLLPGGGDIPGKPTEEGVRVCGAACEFAFDPTQYGNGTGVHVLKIMISDGFDFTDNQFDKVVPGRGSVSYSWCVDLSCVGGGR